MYRTGISTTQLAHFRTYAHIVTKMKILKIAKHM